MTSLMMMVMMQLVVSTKAGLVNHVQGPANVSPMQMVLPGSPIRTGPNGYAEILLTPGSFLRLDENSEATLESVDIANVMLRVTNGAAIVEVVEINNSYPLHVTTGIVAVEIAESGIFRFANGMATIVQGRLQTANPRFVYPKGWQVFYQDTYRARKTAGLKPTGLDVYSQRRSELIARANSSMVPAMRTSYTYWDYDCWLFSSAFGAFTFIPRVGYRSPYGYRYYGVGRPYTVARGGQSGGSNSGTSEGFSGGSNSGGNSRGDSFGGSGSGGGPVVSAPTGQTASPSVYIESKGGPEPASQR
jgi:FecR protein